MNNSVNFDVLGFERFSSVEEYVAANYYRSDGAYKCNLCEYSTAHSSSVKSHVENHLPESERRISCNICGYVCPSKPALRMHTKNKH